MRSFFSGVNVCAAVSVVGAVVGLGVAALALGVGSTPRWSRYRILALTAALAGAFCAAEVFGSLGVSPALLIGVSRVQGLVAVLHVITWQYYADHHLNQKPGRVEQALRIGFVLFGTLWLIPGAMTDPVRTTTVDWLGISLQFPITTTLGSISFLIEVSWLIAPMVRYIRAYRRNTEGPLTHVAGLAALFCAAANDAMVGTSLYRGPFLLSAGFMVCVGAIGLVLARAFIADAKELDRLKQSLEQLVNDRTKELVTAESRLMRSEKLAALGQLSAGVAHEVNNPAAAVTGNLGWLREELATGVIPDDALSSIDDSLEAIDRIAKIVRQLLDLGRAAKAETRETTSLVRAAERALATARPQLRPDVRVVIDIPEDLHARADEASVVQIVTNLVVNAVHAIPEGRAGKIRLVASHVGDRVFLSVADDGTGMSDETKRRIFEPFFTTKPFGQGTGLGLSLSLGIARSLGGQLEARSRPGETLMTLDLPRAQPEVVSPSASGHRRISGPRRKMLLVEDDERVRRALTRMLSSLFVLDVTDGVDAALQRLKVATFDIVLSDWKMPGGGGRKLYERAVAQRPELATAFLFVTGGGLSLEDEEFLESHAVLDKPLAVEKLLAAIQKVDRLAG